MWAGDQWKNVQRVPGASPVFNDIKTSGNYIISTVMSNKRAARIGIEGMPSEAEEGQEETYKAIDLINKYIAHIWERTKFDNMCRLLLKGGAIAGSEYTHTYWVPNKDTNQPKIDLGEGKYEKQMGDFRTERIYASNVMLGNPNTFIIEGQPYVLVSGRFTCQELMKWCQNEDQKTLIVPDEDYQEEPGDRGKIEINSNGGDQEVTGKARAFFYYYMKNGVVWCRLETKFATIYDKPTKSRRYPVAVFIWEERMNSCDGQPFVTQLVPAQRFMNKMSALKMKHSMKYALGMLAIDKTLIENYDNNYDNVINVNGSPSGAVMAMPVAQSDGSLPGFMDRVRTWFKESAGSSDVAQGLVSAKSGLDRQIAVTQATLQLNGIHANLEQFIEDQVLIWVDFIVNYYLDGRMLTYTEEGKDYREAFNGESIRDSLFTAKIDVGPSNLVTEISGIETLNNLYSAGKISDVEYFEALPEGQFPNQKKMLESRKKAADQQAMMQQQQAQMAQNNQEQQMMQAQQSAPITLEEATEGMSEEEIQAMMNDPQKMEELKRMGVV
jgi:hypothetical protein